MCLNEWVWELFLFFCSYGFAFKAASQLDGDVSKFFEQIEDIVQQADETDDKYLQVTNPMIIMTV